MNTRAAASTNGPLSILHILAPAAYGGLESVVRALASGHHNRGHSVAVAPVFPCRLDPHPFVSALESDGVKSIPVRVEDRDYAGERRMLRAICRQHRHHIIHTHGFRSDVIGGIVARSERIAAVSTCHGFIESDMRGRMYQWLQRRALLRHDAVVAVSRGVERKLLRASVSRAIVHFVPNAYVSSGAIFSRAGARRALDLPEGFIIGWVGRVSFEKGLDLALEAFARLRDPKVHLLVIGSGEDEASLRERAADLGVGDRVLWRGAVPDAGKLFGGFDAFFLSSRTEGAPMALLEAMAAEVPVVATAVGGVPDIVDGSIAHVVASGDVNGMATALADVITDQSSARSRAVRARQRLDDRFSAETWLSRYESIYRSVAR